MATLSAQIQSLVGSITETEIDQWCEDGVRELVNLFPPNLKEMCYTKNTFTSTAANSESETIATKNLGNIFAGDIECREIRSKDKYKASDVDSLEYATSTDPVYYVEGSKLNILPASSSGIYYAIADPSIDASADSAISSFPNEAEYLIILYASIKVLQNKMNEKDTNTDIDTTAFEAINTELDETQAVCDKIDADLVLSKAEVVLAKAEAAELATQTDNSSTFNTALAAIATELNKVDNIILEASTEFDKVDNVIIEGSVEIDKSTALLDLGETDSEGAINTALAKVITELDETQAVCDSVNAEIVLANAEVDKSFAEVALANAEVDKSFAEVDLANAEVDKAVTEAALINPEVDKAIIEAALINPEVDLAKAEAAELATQTDNSGDIETALDAMNTALDKFRADASDPALFGDQSQYTTGEGLTHVKDALELARDTIDTGFITNEDSGSSDDATPKSVGYWLNDEDTDMVQATLGVAQTEIQRAKTHIEEWSATVQALLGEANGFAKEAQARVAFSGAKAQSVQSYINTAEGYVKSTNSTLQTADGFVKTTNAFLQTANGFSKTAQGYVQTADGYIKTAQGYATTANGYIKTAQAYGQEIQLKISIANAYIKEVQGRLAQAQAKREESKSRLVAGDSYLKEAQSIVSQGNAYIAEAQAYISQAQGYASEVSARAGFSSAKLQAVQGHINTAQSYVSTAQGFGSEVQIKVNIAQGYIAEAKIRMERENQKYQWYKAQQLKLQQDYDKGVQMLITKGMPQKQQK